jgi:hypothetical protein
MPALLAHDRLEGSHPHGGVATFPKALYLDPLNGATVFRIGLSHKGDIIFHHTGGDASLAANTKLLIDHHAPFVMEFLWNLHKDTSIRLDLDYFSFSNPSP